MRIPTIEDIKREATRKKISLTKLCHLADITPNNVTYWNRGRKPSVRVLEKLLTQLSNLD
jgi:transcriptional regulator with XRE-family HTH domain